MKFKSYAGKDLAEIVPQIREELGPDAVILKQRKTTSGGMGGFFARRGVEVLAADRPPGPEGVDAAIAAAALAEEQAAAGPVAPAATLPAAPAHVDVADDEDDRAALLAETFAGALQERVARIGAEAARAEREQEIAMPAAEALAERMVANGGYAPPAPRPAAGTIRLAAPAAPAGGLHIAPLPAFGRDESLDEEAADLLLELERAGVGAETARALIDEVRLHVRPFGGGILRELARDRIAARIRVEQGWAPDGGPRRIAVVGPSGVGKTSAVVRMAAAWAEAGLSVGLVIAAHDATEEAHPLAVRLGAVGGSEADRLLAYVGGADLARVSSPLEATRALQRFADRDVVIVDTPGMGVGADTRMEAVGRILQGIDPHEVHAALPLALSGREADAALAVLARLGADRLLVTKTDEARFAGPLFDLASRSALPLSYLSTGPRVPGDLSLADGGSIARRILPI